MGSTSYTQPPFFQKPLHYNQDEQSHYVHHIKSKTSGHKENVYFIYSISEKVKGFLTWEARSLYSDTACQVT